jgi:hypothetical protein
MNLRYFRPNLVRRFLALPYRSKSELSGLRELSSSSRKRCTCNWSSFQSWSTLLKDIQALGKPHSIYFLSAAVTSPASRFINQLVMLVMWLR